MIQPTIGRVLWYQIQAAKYVNPQSGALKDTSEQKLSV